MNHSQTFKTAQFLHTERRKLFWIFVYQNRLLKAELENFFRIQFSKINENEMHDTNPPRCTINIRPSPLVIITSLHRVNVQEQGIIRAPNLSILLSYAISTRRCIP